MRIGLGLAALGRPGYVNIGHAAALGPHRDVTALRARTFEVLDAAWAEGVRWFDAARSYGLAEDFLGAWLAERDVASDDVTVSSKWGYTYTADWRADADVHEVKDHSVDKLRGQVIETRERLGEWLDLYQIHSATPETGVLADQAVLAELAALSEEGLAVGLSVSGPRQPDAVRQALEASVDGLNPFRAVQATWNILEPSAGPVLAEAADKGWTVLVKEGVANGRLAPGSGTALPLGSSMRETHLSWPARMLLARIAARNGLSRDALALAAVLAQPWADVVLSGAATVEHLRSNLRALDATLGEDDLADLATLAEPPTEYWATRAALPWT